MTLLRQRGMVVPFIVVVLGTIVLAVIVGANLVYSKQLANSFAADRDAYLDEVRDRVGHWYLRRIDVEADAAFSLTSEELFLAVGATQRYSARMSISPQLSDGVVRYRKVAIVVPDVATEGGQSATYGAYASDGAYTASNGFVVREFDGRSVQHQALVESTRNVQAVATMLEQRVVAKMQIDATRESTTNYFIPKIDCLHVGEDEFPCTDGWIPLSTYLGESGLLGSLSGVPLKNAWGGDILINNEDLLNSTSPPYTVSLLTLAPWGSQVLVKAVQPIF